MKTLRKYSHMGFLIVALATIFPANANLRDECVILKEKIMQHSKRPEMIEKIFQAGEAAFFIAAFIGAVGYASVGVRMAYRDLTGGDYPVYKR